MKPSKIQEVARLRTRGKTFKEIGESLNISTSRAAGIFNQHLRLSNNNPPQWAVKMLSEASSK
jgi:orotate phosphoribosyltransferase-like protein